MPVEMFALDARTGDIDHNVQAVDELIDFVRGRLGGEWTLIRSASKMRKTIFEAEWNGRAVVGKVSKSARAATAHESLTMVWNCGLKPPSRYTVVEPLAWFPERNLIILEKAPGYSFFDAIKMRSGVESAARDAGGWLRRMWNCRAEGKIALFDCEAAVDLLTTLSNVTGSVKPFRLGQTVLDTLSIKPADFRPSHGDFHPMNLFVAEDRVTAIDLDTFAWREREADIGYCLAQTANFGMMLFGSFDETKLARSIFLGECGSVDLHRVRAYMAWTLLQSVHFDLCILKVRNKNTNRILDTVERLLTGSEVSLE